MSAGTGLRGVALLDAAIAQMEARPQSCPAHCTRCENGMTLSAWVAELAGGKWVSAEDAQYGSALLAAEPEDDHRFVHFAEISAHWRAQGLLGIGADDAANLLAQRNSTADIKAIRDGLRNAAAGGAA